MNAAAGLLLYAVIMIWCAPKLLSHITERGIAPRLGVAVWLAAIGGALGAWAAAVTALVVEAFGSGNSAVTFCLEVLGFSGQVGVSPQLGSLAGPALTAGGILVTAVTGRRIFSHLQRMRASSSRHAQEARVIGRPTDRAGVLVVQSAHAVAYCVTGHPRTIVVTSAVLDSLDESELAAVLAHEQAHLTGRHHPLLMVLRALAASTPRLPLFVQGATATARLLEMCADDVAVRQHGAQPLLRGLVALVARPSPASALGAADTAVLARATRLAKPPPHLARWRHRVLLTTSVAVTAVVPVLTALLCHH